MAKSATKNEPNFEESVAELEDIVRRMETGELGREASLEHYQRGMALLRRCRGALDQAEQRIRILQDGELRAPESEEQDQRPD